MIFSFLDQFYTQSIFLGKIMREKKEERKGGRKYEKGNHFFIPYSYNYF